VFYYNRLILGYEEIRKYDRLTSSNVSISSNLIIQLSLPSSSSSYIVTGIWTSIHNKDELYISIRSNSGNTFLLRTLNANEVITANVQWEVFPIPITDNQKWIKDLQFDPNDPKFIYLLFDSDNIWNIDNSGEKMVFKIDATQVNASLNNIDYASWPTGSCFDLTNNLIRSITNSIAIEKGSNGGIYVSTMFGVFYTNDKLISNGTGWMKFGSKLPKVHGSTRLSINYQANVLRIGTFGRGAWEHPLQCPDDFDLTLNTTHSDDDFFEAENNLYSSSTFISNPKISYRGGNQVRLQTGFRTTGSNYFHAYIHACNHSGNSFKNQAMLYSPQLNMEDNNQVSSSIEAHDYFLYPNPTTECITITKNNFIADEIIEIYDLTGSIVKKQVMHNQETKIDVKELNSGMYFIKFKSNTRNTNLKFIKQ
jgi:hypothetical protein